MAIISSQCLHGVLARSSLRQYHRHRDVSLLSVLHTPGLHPGGSGSNKSQVGRRPVKGYAVPPRSISGADGVFASRSPHLVPQTAWSSFGPHVWVGGIGRGVEDY